jgi:hypothetical protein
METPRSISVDEASAALASVRHSRTRVAWSGYPAWYWIITGASMGALSSAMLLPFWWVVAGSVMLAALLVMVARAAGRARGVCEGWTRTAMTCQDTVVLYGPAALVILASAAMSKVAPWSSPWPPIVGAMLVFVLFTGTGLALSARAARR